MLARVLPDPLYAGGVSGQVHLLATALSLRGHEVTVFGMTAPPPGSSYGYRHVALPLGSLGRRLAPHLFSLALSRVTFGDFDLVHSHGDDHFLRTTVPRIRTFHGSSLAEARASDVMRHRMYHASMVIFERMSERKARALTVVSTHTRRYLRRAAVVVPNAIDPTVFHPGGDKSRHPSILFVGELGTRKRGRLLAEIFQREVRARVPDAELWMATGVSISGPGIRWVGRVSTVDLVRLYREAWVFCLPSRYEGFGVPYIEAMACGTPVVATPNGGADEILAGGRWGPLVDDGDLGETLVELLTSQKLRTEFGERGVERSRRYHVDVVADEYEAVYRQAMGAGTSAPIIRRSETR